MLQDATCCRVLSRGFYSCNWRHQSEKKTKCACCWLSVVALVTVLSLCWIYICLVSFNDREDVNWKVFTILKQWVNWFMVMVIISSMLSTYCILLLVFALIQVALREPLDLHRLHQILLFFGVLFITFGVIGITVAWRIAWSTVLLSLQATAPFLQIGAVGALTLLSWFIFQTLRRAHGARAKILIVVIFVIFTAVIFLSPLIIDSPCLTEVDDLPPKPRLIGHRGAPMVSISQALNWPPENTMMSFNRSIECNVATFETDIQLSKDRVPFLMHDSGSGFLLRTTNVTKVFPGQDFSHGTNLTWEELKGLNAGEWFLKADPFHSVSQLTEEQREMARGQTVPSLRQLLILAKQHNISVMFDLKSPAWTTNIVDTVRTILTSGIDQSLIFWLPPAKREYVTKTAPGFVQVYDDQVHMFNAGANHLNVKYSSLHATEIRDLQRRNVSVNLWVVNERWLFSLLWCSGATSVTTNSCHLLQKVDWPDWVLPPGTYLIIWITVDLASLLIMIGLFMCQRRRWCVRDKTGREKQRNEMTAWNQRELSPFLPSA
ncbi:LOW QUALITY PROTEIN: glycerophosphoinositol inositolphosphodiesterase GDPD2 [Thalassophryne amazonica]|uniref:LOW QUALITY PROTEIN: glycerophosphoinositol inositolphosphodiesterase GDPD2 n=1 Tax=Thalassophryne amazonica TaxID=390379 RepID=UPI0014714256|nr:LOW QUALITY PROTEIN: glycerophosphoinositol inositolphosphodiesterase GDPD2 [Thalassophryne amazonica]